jgi:hypothetical protein
MAEGRDYLHKLAQTIRLRWYQLDGAVRYSLILFFIVRVLLSVVAAVAARAFPIPETQEIVEHYIGQTPIAAGITGYLLGPWQRWDALWYTKIARFGYEPGDGSTNLFPLYPLFMKGVGWLLGGRYLFAGIVVSNVAFIASLIYFYKLAELEFGEPFAERSATYLAFFPTAFFLIAPYTESLLLMCTIGAFYYARRHSWIRAGFLGLGAGLTKITGALIALPLLWEYWKSLPEEKLDPDWSGVVLLAPASGALSYMLYRYFFVGNVGPVGSWQLKSFLHHPFLFPSAAQETWQWRFVMPWEGLLRGWEAIVQPTDFIFTVRACLELLAILGLGVAVLLSYRRLSFSYTLYMLLMYLAVLMWVDAVRPFSTIYRHSLLFFPAFLLLARATRHRWSHRLLLSLSISLLVIFTSLFVGWYWMG